MRRNHANTFIVVLLFAAVSHADRPLDRGEVQQLTKDLTSRPANTWVKMGTLYARHTRYRAPELVDEPEIQRLVNQAVNAYLADPRKPETTSSLQTMRLEAIPFNVRYGLTNEYTMTSHVVLRYDGTRFYWEIVVDSRRDSLAVPMELAHNSYARGFDLRWNQRRVFAWDGEKYVTYFRPGNHAIITRTPSSVHGPLTAGIIPWGYGAYAYDLLSTSQASGMLLDGDKLPVLRLTIARDDHTEDFEFSVLQPRVLLSYARTSASEQLRHTYADYAPAGDSFCPRRIVIERFDASSPGRLLASDMWEILAVDDKPPVPGSFDVEYDYDALIEDYRFGAAPLMYRYAPPMPPSACAVGIEQLLRHRLDILCAPDPSGRNCATACLKYVCDRLGVRPSGDDLRSLVSGPGMETTMLQMREFLRERGLNAVAVRESPNRLASLADCQVILHLNEQDHYVVLAGVDTEFVRLIDLDRNGFYYRVPAAQFAADRKRAALLVSDRPLVVAADMAGIDSASLAQIVAAGPCQDCNVQIQSAANDACFVGPGDRCGRHTEHFERWGCGEAQSGTCTHSSMLMQRHENCQFDLVTRECVGQGDWVSSSGQACR